MIPAASVPSTSPAGSGTAAPGAAGRGPRRQRTVVRTLFAAVLALGLSFGAATAASAHDALESSSPADGSSVPVVPDQITLTMSDTPGALGSEIKVLDEAGTNWAQGAVKVVDNLAIEQLRSGAPAGKYTVQWRLVSSDSHPIEGTFSFTADAGSSAGAGAAAGSTAGANPGAAAGTAAPLVKSTEATAPQAASSDGIPWSVIAMIVVLVGLVAGLAFFAKRRLGSED
ncbi:copper resistance CopC family protein [Pseudarthrobacter sp. P1]|uniref:copper resistance CopC family protein n=1 Tax=Pseudarthrobacter sp. P1 TaxID=3418418 RepID=UPI003CEFEABA